jgi:hypothetical protein
MGHVISVQLTQGTNLLRILHTPAFKVGKEVGEKKFSESSSSQANKRMRLFYKHLRKASPLLTEDDKVFFGPRAEYSTWTRKPIKDEIEAGENPDKDVTIYEPKDPKKTVDCDLTGKERDGLYWALFLLAHPSSVFCQGPMVQDQLVWPLAEQIHMTGQLEEDCCLKKGEVVELKDDQEREKEQAEKEEQATKAVDATPPKPAG